MKAVITWQTKTKYIHICLNIKIDNSDRLAWKARPFFSFLRQLGQNLVLGQSQPYAIRMCRVALKSEFSPL